MPTKSLVERSRLAAQRSAGAVSVETSRAWHRENLERDLGRPEGGWARTDIDYAPLRPSLLTTLTRPLTLFLLSILMFLGVFGATLWREGLFDNLTLPTLPKPALPKSDWVLGDRARIAAPAVQKEASPPWPDPYEEVTPPPAAQSAPVVPQSASVADHKSVETDAN